MQQMAGKQESVRDCDVINTNLVQSNKSITTNKL